MFRILKVILTSLFFVLIGSLTCTKTGNAPSLETTLPTHTVSVWQEGEQSINKTVDFLLENGFGYLPQVCCTWTDYSQQETKVKSSIRLFTNYTSKNHHELDKDCSSQLSSVHSCHKAIDYYIYTLERIVI